MYSQFIKSANISENDKSILELCGIYPGQKLGYLELGRFKALIFQLHQMGIVKKV